MNKSNLKLPDGVFAASLTPLNNDLSVNFIMLVNHCRWLLANGCDGIVVMGTTGEANSFSVKERKEILDALAVGGIPAHRLLVGTGCSNISDTVELTNHALSHKAGGVLMLPPFYYKNLNDDGLYAFFDGIIQQINDDDLKVYLYHIPQISGVPFSFSLIKKFIADFPETIVGIKDSSGDWQNMKSLCENFPGFKVYAGSEKFLLEILQKGGAGCISATTNISCRLAAEIFKDPAGSEIKNTKHKVNALRSIIEKYPMIAALKQIMSEISAQEEWLNIRPPLMPLTSGQKAGLMQDLQTACFPEKYL